MNIELIEIKGITIAQLVCGNIEIRGTEDILDLIGNCGYQGAGCIILHEKNIVPEFFDLKTGIAGDILQKFSTYSMKLAIVGNFSKYTSKSLNDFIFESNKTGRINFVNSLDEAREKLTQK